MEPAAHDIIGGVPLQLQSGQHHDDGQGVEAPEDDPLEIGVIDAQYQQEALHHERADAQHPGGVELGMLFQPGDLPADQVVAIEQGCHQQRGTQDTGLGEELQVDAVDVLHILTVGVQEALGDQGVELIPADAEEGTIQEGIDGQGVELQSAGGDVLAAQKLLNGHHIADHGRELLQPGQQRHDGDEARDAGDDTADDQEPALLPAAQGDGQQTQADGGAQQLAPASHQHDGVEEHTAAEQGEDALPVELPSAGGVAAADGDADEEHIVGVGAAAQGKAVALGHIVAQVAACGVGELHQKPVPEVPGIGVEEEHEHGHDHGAQEAGGQTCPGGALAWVGEHHEGTADDHGDDEGDGLGVMPGIRAEEVDEYRQRQHQEG